MKQHAIQTVLDILQERHLRIDPNDPAWPNRDRLHAEPGAFEKSVRAAIAGRWISRYFNRPGLALFAYHVIAVAREGDMPENISLPAHLQLSNLVWVYLVEDQRQDELVLRFMCEGWNVVRVRDAIELEELDNAFRIARGSSSRPTLIVVGTKVSRISAGRSWNRGDSAEHGRELRAIWATRFRLYTNEYPELAEQLEAMPLHQLADSWSPDLALRCFSPI